MKNKRQWIAVLVTVVLSLAFCASAFAASTKRVSDDFHQAAAQLNLSEQDRYLVVQNLRDSLQRHLRVANGVATTYSYDNSQDPGGHAHKWEYKCTMEDVLTNQTTGQMIRTVYDVYECKACGDTKTEVVSIETNF